MLTKKAELECVVVQDVLDLCTAHMPDSTSSY